MTMTPRDRLQRLVDLGRKTLRYWWLVVVFALAGGALSLAFALIRPKNYQSYAVLFYQERIRSSLLYNREEQIQRQAQPARRFESAVLIEVERADRVIEPIVERAAVQPELLGPMIVLEALRASTENSREMQARTIAPAR